MKDEQLDALLLPIERRSIPDHYKAYYFAKRNNFFAGLQNSRKLWGYYQLLDKILIDEFADLTTARDINRVFPMALYFNAHAKIRVSLELAFSRCMEEARSIMRDAIESAVFAHYMLGDPALQIIWLSKDEDERCAKAFKDAFEKNRLDKTFKGLPELHQRWGHLCETGAHSTPQAIATRFKIEESNQTVRYVMNYTGVADREWEPEVFTLLQVVSMIENLVFSDYRDRLQLDHILAANRGLAQQFQEQIRLELIEKHKIPPPSKALVARP